MREEFPIGACQILYKILFFSLLLLLSISLSTFFYFSSFWLLGLFFPWLYCCFLISSSVGSPSLSE